MMKFLLLFLFLLGCSKNPSDPSQKIYYAYGLTNLPGSLPPLDASYEPASLSSKSITLSGTTYVRMDILSQELTLTFDVSTQKVVGQSLIRFKTKEHGVPYFELLANLPSVKLDTGLVTLSDLQDPDGQGQKFWSIGQSVRKDVQHELEVSYELPFGRVGFSNGGVGFLTSMRDVSNANFLEHWAPVAFEDDAFELTLDLRLQNATSAHKLYTNGSYTTGTDHWRITFPEYFTKSSFYVHLTDSSLVSRSFVYHGIEKDIPVEVYSASSSLVDVAINLLPGLFQEFEIDFGSYPHDSFTAYMHSGGGGMEYSGATITSIGALDHELFHSWFARGVIPADGRSGWIDEAFASWRDYGYFQAPDLLYRGSTNLSNFSSFRKSTPSNCYVDGRKLISELDRLFAPFGGMKPIMRLFFDRYKKRSVTNEEFWQFLSMISLMDVSPFYQRYTLGGASTFQVMSDEEGDLKHPKPLSDEEIKALR